jgi:hypothetical protein
MLLSCIWEVPGSNLGHDINRTDSGFSWISLVLPDKGYSYTLSLAMTTSFCTLFNLLFPVIKFCDTVYSEVMTVSLNKL